MAWNPGQTLHNGEYRIEQELGRGRFAITYLAKDRNGKASSSFPIPGEWNSRLHKQSPPSRTEEKPRILKPA